MRTRTDLVQCPREDTFTYRRPSLVRSASNIQTFRILSPNLGAQKTLTFRTLRIAFTIALDLALAFIALAFSGLFDATCAFFTPTLVLPLHLVAHNRHGVIHLGSYSIDTCFRERHVYTVFGEMR
ncbi:hypothetical protein J3R82DRAFT_10055 [Butyriboletus roseoflavus]|nr:hypothetical protein J3R82DRAFT_10055 [Butyriboletus roseoflavus]